MKSSRGFVCCGLTMIVFATRNPAASLVVRYRKCPVCDRRTATEERISKTRKQTPRPTVRDDVSPMT